MDNIHVTQTPIKQKEPYLNSFNLKSLDNAEKGGGHQDHGSSSALSVPVIIFLGILTVIAIFVLVACLLSSIHRLMILKLLLIIKNISNI